MNNRDIHIRRISSQDGTIGKGAVKVFELLNQEIDKRNLRENLGEIDYVVVLDKTKLEQNDFIGFLAFKNREIHEIFINKFNSPLPYAGREMLFEINYKNTPIELQSLNRKRFEMNKQKYSSKRYFDQLKPNKTDEDDYQEYVDEEPAPKRHKCDYLTAVDLLNSKIPEFLEAVRNTTVKNIDKKPEEFIPLSKIPTELNTEIRVLKFMNKSLENRNKQLEEALAKKTLEVEKLEEEREMLKSHYLSGFNLFKNLSKL